MSSTVDDSVSGAATAPARVVLVVGPSGTGKTTLVNGACEWITHNYFKPVVSHTTRAPRNGEVDGRDYHFMRRVDDMTGDVAADAFVERAQYGDAWYGTSWDALRDACADGAVALHVVEMAGARAFRDAAGANLEVRFIRVTVGGDDAVLRERLMMRCDTVSSFQRRVARAPRDRADADDFEWDVTIDTRGTKHDALDTFIAALEALTWEYIPPPSAFTSGLVWNLDDFVAPPEHHETHEK